MKTVLCHGVFDVLHAGHLNYFEEAKKYGDRLVVSITADRFVNKGPGRPHFPAEKRASMLRALKVVDEVFISEEPTAVGAIRRFSPDFFVKGSDYRDLNKDVTGEILNEKRTVEELGGKLVFTSGDVHSSSTLINRFFHNWSDEQKAQIEKINAHGGMGAIERAIEEISKLKVLVIGEPIIDIYRFCNPEGISSKSPTISARFQYQEEYGGGSIAIVNHLAGFCNVRSTPELPSVKKIRYISSDKSQRIFEVTEIDEKQWPDPSSWIIANCKAADVVVAADFGHGLFEGPVLEAMQNIEGFVGLNVQTNSSNFGFNVYTKHTRYDYLCLDTREARLAEHDRYSSPMEIARRINNKSSAKYIGLTTGSNGATLVTANKSEYSSPAFTDVVLDATGAGDAYFAITTALLASGCKPELIPFIGNVFAGLKTKIIGNKSSVSKASLLKACQAILK